MVESVLFLQPSMLLAIIIVTQMWFMFSLLSTKNSWQLSNEVAIQPVSTQPALMKGMSVQDASLCICPGWISQSSLLHLACQVHLNSSSAIKTIYWYSQTMLYTNMMRVSSPFFSKFLNRISPRTEPLKTSLVIIHPRWNVYGESTPFDK